MGGVFVALRLISLVLIAVGIMLLGADLVTSLEKGGHLTVRTVEEVWKLLDAGGPAAFLAALPSWLASLVQAILGLWAFAVAGVPGIILAFLFGRRTADVGD